MELSSKIKAKFTVNLSVYITCRDGVLECWSCGEKKTKVHFEQEQSEFTNILHHINYTTITQKQITLAIKYGGNSTQIQVRQMLYTLNLRETQVCIVVGSTFKMCSKKTDSSLFPNIVLCMQRWFCSKSQNK